MKFATLAVVAVSALAANAQYYNASSVTTTVTYCPGTVSSGVSTVSTYPTPSSNGTTIAPSGTISHTPVGPSGSTSPTSPPPTGGAISNSAGSALAIVALAAAYLL